jgi:hypothetical protein
LISEIIADYVEVLVLEAGELATRLAPYQRALRAFVSDHADYPNPKD